MRGPCAGRQPGERFERLRPGERLHFAAEGDGRLVGGVVTGALVVVGGQAAKYGDVEALVRGGGCVKSGYRGVGTGGGR